MGPNFDLKRGRKVPTKNSTPTVNRRANFQSHQTEPTASVGLATEPHARGTVSFEKLQLRN